MKPHTSVATTIAFTLLFTPVAFSVSLRFDRYHSQEEINDYLMLVTSENPQLVKLQSLGFSQQGRPLNYLIISKKTDVIKPAIYVNATHHGNEHSSTEVSLGIIDAILATRDEPSTRDVLLAFDIIIQPLVNPDGHAMESRFELNGRDPNRDYGHSHGAAPAFQIPEIAAVKKLVDSVSLKGALALHSGNEAVFWPFGYQREPPSEEPIFRAIAQDMISVAGFKLATQSYHDYPSQGELIDYLYETQRTIALTVEVSQLPKPPKNELKDVVKRGIKMTERYLMQMLTFAEAPRLASVASDSYTR